MGEVLFFETFSSYSPVQEVSFIIWIAYTQA